MFDNETGVNVTVKIPKSEHDAFKKICKSQDLSQSQVIRALVREYIKNNAQGALL